MAGAERYYRRAGGGRVVERAGRAHGRHTLDRLLEHAWVKRAWCGRTTPTSAMPRPDMVARRASQPGPAGPRAARRRRRGAGGGAGRPPWQVMAGDHWAPPARLPVPAGRAERRGGPAARRAR
ncbi:hypothetical protein HBB16_02405 [Pseudonocardia sp. MCCB 268]|nr:hypothetical protein [Pseudonocardia cytotoxica]